MAPYEYSKLDVEEKMEEVEESRVTPLKKRCNAHRQHRIFVACAILILVPIMTYFTVPADAWAKIPHPSAESMKKMFTGCRGKAVQSESLDS